MFTNHRLGFVRAFILSVPLLIFESAVWAEDAPPAEPGIVEGFTCSYLPGKDRADLMAARDYLVRQAGKANLTLEPSYVWELFKGAVPANLIWLSFHENLAAFGAATDASGAAAEMADVAARFGTVVNCQANLGSIRPVYQGTALEPGGTRFIASSACRARGPMSEGDIADMRGHINDVLGSMPSFKNVSLYAIEPITGAPDGPDVYLFSVHDNATNWATRNTELAASAAGQSLRRHFDNLLDCDTSLWFSQRVIAGPSPAN